MVLTGGAVYSGSARASDTVLSSDQVALPGGALRPVGGRPHEPGKTLAGTCRALCLDIEMHADHINAAIETLSYTNPLTEAEVYGRLVDGIVADLKALEEATGECTRRRCACCGGPGEKLS